MKNILLSILISATAFCQAMAEPARRMLAEERDSIAGIYYTQFQLADERGDVNSAIDWVSKAADLYRDLKGGKSTQYWEAETILGQLYAAKGDYRTALTHHLQSYDVVGELECDQRQLSMENIRRAYFKLREYPSAVEWNLKLINDLKSRHFGTTKKLVDALASLSMTYYAMKDATNTRLSIAQYRMHYTLLDSSQRNTSEWVSLNIFDGMSAYNLGMFREAWDTLIAIADDDNQEELDKQSAVTLYNLYNYLGICALRLEDAAEASAMFDRAEEVLNSKGEEFTPEFLQQCRVLLASNRTLIADDAGDGGADPGLQAIDQAIQLGHPYLIATTMTNYALTRAMNGDLDEADHYLRAADPYVAQLTPDFTTSYSEMLVGRVLTAVMIGSDEPYLKSLIMATSDFYRKWVLEAFPTMTENERSKFWEQVGQWFVDVLPVAVISVSDSQINEMFYSDLLLSKGILLASTTGLERIVKNSGDDNLLDLLNQLNDVRERYNSDPDSYETAQRGVEMLERRMLQLAQPYGNFTEPLKATAADVSSQLKPGDIAIEFFTTAIYGAPVYMAACLSHESATPRLIMLDAEESIQRLRLTNPLTELDGQLYSTVWAPILEAYPDTKRIFFAPTGLLHSIPIEYCAIDDGGESLFDRYEVYRLSSTREILNKHNANHSGKVALFGNVDYNATSQAVQSANIELNGQRTIAVAADRGADDEWRKTGVIFSKLQYTKPEIDSIANSCHLHSLPQVTYENTRATESAVKSLSGSPVRLLHFATHGYYIPSTQGVGGSPLQQAIGGGYNPESASLSRSGLAFAGVNNLISSGTPDDNGVLTAAELALLDFNDVDMAVVSACESGLGELNPDGVFGLQRGFKKAGVKGMLMTLLKINDKSTFMFMNRFYDLYLQGKSPIEAVRAAQKHVRSTEGGHWDNNRFWAPYILIDAYNPQ